MLYRFVRFIAFLFFRFFCRVDIKGRENIPEQGGFILASNHLSYLDPAVLAAACRRRLNFMARDNLFKIPVFSQLIAALGAFPVKRNSPDFFALKQAAVRIKQGAGVLIFPEGTRKKADLSSRAQGGVGFLAVKSQAPLIPAFIKGTDLVLPKGAKFIRPKKIRVYFGREMPIERSQSYNYQDIADEVMRGIQEIQKNGDGSIFQGAKKSKIKEDV